MIEAAPLVRTGRQIRASVAEYLQRKLDCWADGSMEQALSTGSPEDEELRAALHLVWLADLREELEGVGLR